MADTQLDKGLFVTLEGIEGMGKTTCLKYLTEHLSLNKTPLLITYEPGGTPLANDIRHFLLREHTETVEPETEMLLMFAARAQHVKNAILPALKAGKLVISDRFIDTTYAYQGGGRGVSFEKIQALERIVLNGLTPDLTILFDAPVDIGLKRIQTRTKSDRFESETKQFFSKCQQAYHLLVNQNPERFFVVNAELPPQELHKLVADKIDSLLNSHLL